jgi:hypothetical protein
MPQARAAPARGLRLAGKRSLPLPREASARATRSPQRHPAIASIARTPQNESLKAPAKSAARAPPDRVGHPKLTARSYPPSPPSPAAIRGSPLPRVANFARVPYPEDPWLYLPLRLPRGWLYNSVGKDSTSGAHPTRTTVAVGRSGSVVREIEDGGPRRKVAEDQAAGAT